MDKEAALALGATKWEMVRAVVLPSGRSAIVASAMLGFGRALGETMAVLMILSPARTYSLHLLSSTQNQTIAANIAAQFPEADNNGVGILIASGIILFVISFVANVLARKVTRQTSQRNKS
jgi:phosphate transport system permease protein